MERQSGLNIIINSNSTTLILGSFPSVISRKNDFYYANKTNRFWKTLESIYKKNIGEDNNSKAKFILDHNLALFDVVKSCKIQGSLDKNILDYQVNDLDSIIKKYNIKYLIFNGKTAFTIYKKYFNHLSIVYFTLPSTSAANTRFDYSKWEDAFKYLNVV